MVALRRQATIIRTALPPGTTSMTTVPAVTDAISQVPDALGRFGRYGGRYVPETLSAALDQLERAYEEACAAPRFAA